MRPVNLGVPIGGEGGFKDWVIEALKQIEQASHDEDELLNEAIDEAAVTEVGNDRLTNMATGTVKARGTALTGDPEDIPVANGLELDATSLRTKQQMSITVDGSGLKLSGDETSPGNDEYFGTDGAGAKGYHPLPTVADGSITNAKLANMAEATAKGRAVGAGTGVPTDLTAAQLWAVNMQAASLPVPRIVMLFEDHLSSGTVGGAFDIEPGFGSTLSGNVRVDSAGDKFRVYETGGSARGFNVDLTTCAAGAGTNLLGTQLVEALAAGTGTTATSAAIATAYKVFLLAFDGISHNNGAVQTLRVEISTDGGISYSTAQNITSAIGNTAWSFAVHIYNANQTAKVITSDGSAGGIGATVSRANAVTHLRFSWSAGNFDAGTIYIFGQ